MSINVSGNILSSSGFTPSGEITNTPNVVTDGLLLWYDAGNLASYNNSANYYDCGYGCQYYASSPGCTNCNTQIKDMSGYGNDGTFTGTTITYTGATGGAMFFDGSNDYVPISGTFMNTSFNYSVSVWFKKNTTANQKFLIGKDSSGSFIQYGIYWNVTDNIFKFRHATTVSTVVETTYTSWNANVIGTDWHNVVGLWDGSNIRLYGDGVAVGTPTAAATGYAFTDASRHSVGRYGGFNGWYFDGNIAIVMIHGRALTAAEVLQNFNADRSRFGI
jgi:hypothetical protein